MFYAPPKLQKGDTIIILSTARQVSESELLPCMALLEEWGLKVKLGNTIGKVHHQFAGDDACRTADLQAALDDPAVKAILCARGGYGTVRILDKIDFTGFRASPKWVIGFSDVTYLHQHINLVVGVQTIHAPMAFKFPEPKSAAAESLQQALFERRVTYGFQPHPLNRNGRVKGVLTGGNLSILYSLTGTRTVMNFSNKVLFLEDLDEYLYHFDRMMYNLERAGKLQQISGLVCGGLTDMKDNTIPFGWSAEEIIAQHASAYNFPLVFDFPAGHVADNRALIMGAGCELIAGEQECSLLNG